MQLTASIGCDKAISKHIPYEAKAADYVDQLIQLDPNYCTIRVFSATNQPADYVDQLMLLDPYYGTIHVSSVANQPAKTAATQAPVQQGNLTLLKQDSGTNLSKMNITFVLSPTYGSAQTVKFTTPKPGWKLEKVLVMATDFWNSSRKELPTPLQFAIEIRDKDMNLLYHFADMQLPYFTHPDVITMADIEVPAMPMSGEFYVCFYGYRSLGIATELQNATGNSYYFDKPTERLYPGVVPLRNNQTLRVNWLIRVAGQ